jgi:hypothetical protein
MKYRAPEGVTALSCAGESIVPNTLGIFEASEELAVELAAHGCVAVAVPDDVAGRSAEERPARGRARADRAN